MRITKETISQLKAGDVLEGFLKDKKIGEVITLTYEVSDVEVEVLKIDKIQHYFKGITKSGCADFRTASIDVLDSALTWSLKK